MLQVTALLIISILTGQVIPIEAADEELNLSFPKLHHTQYINEADSPSFCTESACDYGQLYCNKSVLLLQTGNCATYNEKTKILSIFKCPYFQFGYFRYVYHGSMYVIQLPMNLSHQLNDYMCDPMNRKGLVCSECADGFGPSLSSFEYRCANCSDMKYAVPFFVSRVCSSNSFLCYLFSISNQHNISSNALLYHVCPDNFSYF